MKKIIKIFLVIAMCFISAFPNHLKAKSNIDCFREAYKEDSCFYQITDKQYLDSFGEDDVIDYFYGIAVTKRILDENLILDIEKVEEKDLIVDNENSVMTLATETSKTLSSGYDSAVVIKKLTETVDNGLGQNIVYNSFLYLSNAGLQKYLLYDYSTNTYGSTMSATFGAMIVGIALSFIPNASFGVVFALITGVSQMGAISATNSFRANLTNMLNAGYKVKITLTTYSQSCSRWTSNTYYYENATRNGLIINSTYAEYKN